MAKNKRAVQLQPPAIPVDQRYVRFSFEYLDLSHKRFRLEECSLEYLQALIREILKYQKFTVDKFIQADPREHRHPIYFPDTHEPDGFDVDPSSEELWTDTAWQFGLASGSHHKNGWRVHGFLAEETFYIVWLDPKHRLDT